MAELIIFMNTFTLTQVAQPMPVTSVMTTSQPRPTNYLVPAILTCLCCFWPTGICAILAARSVSLSAKIFLYKSDRKLKKQYCWVKDSVVNNNKFTLMWLKYVYFMSRHPCDISQKETEPCTNT